MDMRCETVRVKSEHAPGGYVVINKSDLTPEHEVVEAAAPLAASAHGDVVIPDDWQSMHWKRLVKLAKALGRGGEPSGDEAKAFIALKVQERLAR